jgi:protein required for attachment to host cells
MSKLRIPHDAFVFVGDSRKALFLRKAAAMEEVVRSRKVPALVVVAPPKTLADLREAFHADVRGVVFADPAWRSKARRVRACFVAPASR